MAAYVYFVRFRVSKTLGEIVEGSLIMRRKKFIGANEDLENVERYVAKYAGVDMEKVAILTLNMLHGLSDI